MTLTITQFKLKLGITDDSQDDLLNLLLDQAKDAVMKYHYGAAYLPTDLAFLDQFSYQALDIAIYLYNKMGVEGQNVHKEQGVDREYGSSHIPPEMFDGIPKKVRTLYI
jgi:hypothetical protein